MDERDESMKSVLDSLEVDILCIHGNHEIRPANIPSYKLQERKDGKVTEKFIFLRADGTLQLGAYSVDKFYRQVRGMGGWEDNSP